MESEASAMGGTQQHVGRANVDLEQELAEAHRREAATAEVLKAISRSTFNLQDVLDSLVKSAVQLTGAETGLIFRQDGELYRPAAIYDPDPKRSEAAKQNPVPKGRQSATGRAVLERRVVHISDVLDDPEYTWAGRQKAGNRTVLAGAILRVDIVVGVIVCAHHEVRPFTAKQIELVQTFADQAVIAIENTRLFEEVQARTRDLQESLEYQIATSEVLGVISRSPTELQPILDSIAATAARLCESVDAQVFRVRDGKLAMVAQHRTLPRPGATFSGVALTRGSVIGRAVLDQQTIHVDDLAALVDSEFPDSKAYQATVGHRTTLATPLLRRGESIGAILMRRIEVRPFSEKQRVLLQVFADQGVIAIENARLFEEVQARTKELQESLDRQTATSEVLGVISRSPNEVQPVLDTIVATAQRLCQAERASVWRLEGETFRAVAHHGLPEEEVERVYSARVPLSRGSMVGRAILARRAVQVEDVATDPELVATHALSRASNIHTILAVPLLLKGEPIGGISLTRTRVAPFDDKQVALVEAFADQAVIAIENSRLFEAEQASKCELEARTRELQESLEYQTAMSEVLSVISKSPNDLQPVLDAIVATAHRLCQAEYTLFSKREDDSLYHIKASVSADPGFVEWVRAHPIATGEGSMVGLVAAGKETTHFPDCLAEPRFTDLDRQQQSKARTMLGVPLLRENEVIGVIFLARTVVQPFTERQIALVTTFADQAVIAIENTRLFEAEQASKRELTESLEQQTATADVLKVISR